MFIRYRAPFVLELSGDISYSSFETLNFPSLMQSSLNRARIHLDSRARDVPRVVNVSRATRESGVPMNYDFDDHLDRESSNRTRRKTCGGGGEQEEKVKEEKKKKAAPIAAPSVISDRVGAGCY